MGQKILSLFAALLITAVMGSIPVHAKPEHKERLQRKKLHKGDFVRMRLEQGSGRALRASFRMQGEATSLELEPNTVRAPGFEVFVFDASGKRRLLELPPETTYKGRIPGRPDVRVAASVCRGKMTALMRDELDRFWVIEPEEGSEDYAVYQAEDAMGDIQQGCQVRSPSFADFDEGSAPTRAEAQFLFDNAVNAAPGTSIADIAFDADYEYYTRNNSSVADTIADIENVMNAVNLIYERDVQIAHQVVSINVRTTPGAPYTSTSPGTLLDQFQAEWNANFRGTSRDIAHLMTGKSLDGNTIGIAYLGVICNGSFGYGLSESRFSGTFSRRVALTAHELGHNWGASHDATGSIMCASVGACGQGVDRFRDPAINSIVNHRNSRSCLETVPDLLPDLVLTKTVNADPAIFGDALVYTLVVTNEGTAVATGVVVEDMLPAGLNFVSAVPAAGVSLNSQTLNANVGTLGIGAGYSLQITVLPQEPGTYVNQASVSSIESDLNGNDNEAQLSSDVLPALDVSPTSLAFTLAQGGGVAGNCISLILSNRQSAVLSYAFTAQPAWLDLSLNAGSIGTDTMISIDACLNSQAEALSGGDYAADLVLSNLTLGRSITIPVTLAVAETAAMPFSEDFETGSLATYWETSGTGDSRIQVTTANGPDTGAYHLTMDDAVNGGGSSRNELTLTVNLAGYSQVELTYRAREYSDENHAPPTSFTGGANFDGVAISADGTTWYTVADHTSNGAQALQNSYQTRVIDLDAALALHGLDYNALFKIRFNQYDNFGITTDGMALDNISLTGVDATSLDSDDDGLPNVWEAQFFGSETNAVAFLDSDGDGLDNLSEFIADTNPTSEVSFLSLQIEPVGSGGFELRYLSSDQRVYSIACFTNLLSPTPLLVLTNRPGNGLEQILLQEESDEPRYYRLQVNLPD